MRSRVNFLRNPRFPNILPKNCIGTLKDDLLDHSQKGNTMKKIELKSKQTTKLLQSIGGGIVAEPSSIFFTDYIPGKTYVKILSIKNKTPHSGRFRLSSDLNSYSTSSLSICQLHLSPQPFNSSTDQP